MYLPLLYVNNHEAGDVVQSCPSTVSRTILSELILCALIQLALAMAALVYVEFPVVSARYAARLEED